MLSTDLTGNLSDNLTRYCICREVAEKNNYKYGINPIVSHDYFDGKEQMYFFEDIDYGIPNNVSYGSLPEGINNIWEEKREFYNGYNYHPFQKDIFNIPDNTKLIIYCGQDANYLNKEMVMKWLKIKRVYQEDSKQTLIENNIALDDNTCVINCRGGEYRGVDRLFLTHNYWDKAINIMRQRNPNFKFIVITEDPEFYKTFFDFPVYHFNIHTDYYILNNAKNLIVSNSGFGIFPIWTNRNNPFVIAPYLWANHNYGDNDEWANSNMKSWKCFNFMDRNGNFV